MADVDMLSSGPVAFSLAILPFKLYCGRIPLSRADLFTRPLLGVIDPYVDLKSITSVR